MRHKSLASHKRLQRYGSSLTLNRPCLLESLEDFWKVLLSALKVWKYLFLVDVLHDNLCDNIAANSRIILLKYNNDYKRDCVRNGLNSQT